MPRKKREPDLYRGIERYQIARMSSLKPIVTKLNEQYGEGGWGDDQVVDYILAKQVRDANKTVETKQKKKRTLDEIELHKRQLTTKLNRYLERFADTTPNDVIMLRELCEIELQLEDLGLRDTTALADQKIASELRLKLIAEHRRMQTDLGISRGQREGEVDATAQFRRLIEGGQKMLAERAIPIRCPHCADRKQRLNLGAILYHFKDHAPWYFQTTCPNPKCGQEIILQGGPARVTPVAVPPAIDESVIIDQPALTEAALDDIP